MGSCGCREREKEEDSQSAPPPEPPQPIQSSAVDTSAPVLQTPPQRKKFKRADTLAAPQRSSKKAPVNRKIRGSLDLGEREGLGKVLKEPFESLYKPGKNLLYKTESYQVYYAEFLPTRKNCLVKQLNKRGAEALVKANHALATQAQTWTKVIHPGLVPVLDLLQDDYFLYIVSTACTGLPLSQLSTALTPNQAASVLFCVLTTLKTVHSEGLLHLSICLGTVLLVDQELKLAMVLSPVDLDAKVARESKDWEVFRAPEREKTEKSDVWSCGIVLFYMLTLELPFSADTYSRLSSNFPEIQWKGINTDAKSLISRMLSRNPASRLSLNECLADSWLLSNRPSVNARVLSQNTESLRSANQMTPIKAAVLNFLVTRVLKGSQIAKISEVFCSMDTDGSGTLTPAELRKGLERIMPPKQAEEEVRKITSSVQIDQDETISYLEYLFSSLDQTVLFSEDNLRVAYDYFDSDRSGTVSAEELKAQLFGSSEQSVAMWRELSRHAALRNGNVTFEEFVEMLSEAH